MDPSIVGLRMLREVAERGSFTAAALAMGYSQSAVSRQVAALEAAAHAELFERRPDGVRPTAAGRVLLRHATVMIDEIDSAAAELRGLPAEAGSVRLGAFTSAGAVLVPRALATLHRVRPAIEVTTREATSPALVRALRAGTLDLALLASAPPFRAPDGEAPALVLDTLTEVSLLVAAPAGHPLAGGDSVHVDDLQGQRWVASRSTGDETLLGVWPGLAGRQQVSHTARDWLTKLQLVAAGCGLTTVPALLASVLPAGVRLLAVEGGPHELRRLVLARLPGPMTPAVTQLRRALLDAAAPVDAQPSRGTRSSSSG
jgi:DNA-binding transcriptional LysR family regulator